MRDKVKSRKGNLAVGLDGLLGMEMGWTDNGSGEWEIDDREKDDDRDRGSSKKKRCRFSMSITTYRARGGNFPLGSGLRNWLIDDGITESLSRRSTFVVNGRLRLFCDCCFLRRMY